MYDNVIVIGTGRLALECLSAASRFAPVELVENERANSFATLEKACAKKGHVYSRRNKRDTMDYLRLADSNTLVISARNTYLFPADVVGKPDFDIVNFHHALLPRHPGRNAEVWAIYEGDEKSGGTWHYVDENVDAGYLIAQREVALTDAMTAWELFQKLFAETAVELFCEIVESVFCKNAPRTPLRTNPSDIRPAADVPNGGVLELDWDYSQTSAFLRSTDFGKIPLFPPAKAKWNGVWHQWNGYELAPDNGVSERGIYAANGNLTINCGKGAVTLKTIHASPPPEINVVSTNYLVTTL
jgi:methionyl-tRNA formyltransferase